MSQTVDQGLRSKLEERGLWVAFREWRRDLKDKLGLTPVTAREYANRAFLLILAGDLELSALRAPDKLPVVPPCVSDPDSKNAPINIPPPSEPVADSLAEVRKRKSARFAAEFRWVIRNRREAMPDLATCPDIEAYNILLDCKDDVSLYKSLLVEFGRRGLSRDDGDDRHGDEIDGQAEVDALDLLLGAADDAEGSAS